MRLPARSLVITSLLVIAVSSPLSAQVPGKCETPVRERTSEMGCYLLDSLVVGTLPASPVFWHIYRLAARDSATAAPAGSAIVDAFGTRFIVAIAPRTWTPGVGTKAAAVGPLQVTPGMQYIARFMRSSLTPGIQTAMHTHPGPEAWFLLDGRQCVETPAGQMIVHSGEGVHIPGGPPMVLMSPGPEAFHSLVLVLHDATHAWIDRASAGWSPKGLCTVGMN